LERLVDEAEPIRLASLTVFEWLRGPRTQGDLATQEALLPMDRVLPFGEKEARVAARIYCSLSRARGREVDIGIAATAICQDARLWTLNPKDFADIPGLSLWKPR